MTSPDLARLQPHLEPVKLPKYAVLAMPGVVSDFTYFPEGGVGSIVVPMASGPQTNVALFGREGLAPFSGVWGMPALPYQVTMQIDGLSHRIANVHLWIAMAESVTLRTLLGRYLHSMFVQMAYTASANAANRIDARLARWLLMCHDRTDGDEIDLTHEALSNMLTVRRQSITTALHSLEGQQLISAARGVIRIRNRTGLRALAEDTYGIAEREYAASVGGMPTKE